jgi:hypothetical protein
MPFRWWPHRLFFVSFVVAHAATSIGLFMLDFSRGMSRFDSGLPPSWVDSLLSRLSNVFLSPLFLLVARSWIGNTVFSGILGYLPLLANSVLWALGAWWLLQLARRLAARRSGTRDYSTPLP